LVRPAVSGDARQRLDGQDRMAMAAKLADEAWQRGETAMPTVVISAAR
jgi:hypothetical protein